METENKRIVEINGIKLEIDLRTARRIDEFKIGDPIKVLKKGYSDYKVHAGIIVGFDDFKERPTITVLSCANSYGENIISLDHINEDTKDVEIAPVTENSFHELTFTKDEIVRKFNKEIENAETKVRELKDQRRIFDQNFGRFFIKQQEIVEPF